MPARKDVQAKIRTRLARARVLAGVTQERLAEATGIPLATYRRLERGQLENPPIRYLSNIALALDLELEEICEDEWLWWTVFREGQADEPPNPQALLEPHRWNHEVRMLEGDGLLKEERRGFSRSLPPLR